MFANIRNHYILLKRKENVIIMMCAVLFTKLSVIRPDKGKARIVPHWEPTKENKIIELIICCKKFGS